MTSHAERRSQCRYQVNHLSVAIKSLQHLHHDWDERTVDAIDFNRYGISLETDISAAIGDVLKMSIRTEQASVADIEGLVCNRTQTEKGFRLGIRFEYQGDQDVSQSAPNISEEILMMERQAQALEH